MATVKKAALVFEMGDKQIALKDIEDAVKAVKGAKTAYINTVECAAYCVDDAGNTTKVELTAE